MSVDRISIANEAQALHAQGKLHDAIGLYEKALAGDPAPSPMVQYYAGMAYLSAGKPRKAEGLLGAAAAAVHRADFHLAYGNALYALKWYGRAQKALEVATMLEPSNAIGWFNLGNAAQAAHDNDTAISAFRTALDNDPLLLRALPNLITVMIEATRFDDVATLMRQMQRLGMWKSMFYDVSLMAVPAAAAAGEAGDTVLAALEDMRAQSPDDPQVLCLLGNFFLMRAEFEKAEACYIDAVNFPDQVGAYRAAGILAGARGDVDLAKTHLERAVESDPDGEQALKLANLVMQLSDTKIDTARLFDPLRDLYPDSETLYNAQGSWLSLLSDWKNLARILEDRVAKKEDAEDLSNLGAAYMNMKQETAALKHLHRAAQLDKKKYSTWYNISVVLVQQGREVEAFEAGKKAFLLEPKMVSAAAHLAMVASKLNQNAEAERILKRGLRHNPDSIELLNLLGNCRLKRGDTKGAFECFARARANAVDDGAQYAMQLMAVNYSADIAPEIVADMHFKWGDARVVATKQCEIEAPAVLKEKLKIAYLSGDYKNHSCSYFIAPLLANHDPDRVEVYCYMTEDYSDEVTQIFRQTARHWRDISKLSDEEAAELVQQDGIDILVELSGHTSGGRLGLMTMKPAPIQVTWLGYPNTTGLPTIDYRFTDALADPPGMTDKYCREKLYRLPNFLCYQPPEFTPGISPLPARTTGHITFGCFNNSNKITDEVVAVWAKIMKRVPGSKMVLKTSNLGDSLALSAFRKKFQKNGIDPDRIECFQGFRNKSDHLMTYADIDLALDPFPYNGTTTTFESLWMGVPMVTYAGAVHAARVGHAIMTGVGFGEFVADSIPDYIEKAVSIALDVDRLEDARRQARTKLQTSPLMDGAAFAKSMEDAFFDMWHHAVQETTARRKTG
jgi:predicted O-linked N-acetylglucosamine transferase (SPINDLY family)